MNLFVFLVILSYLCRNTSVSKILSIINYRSLYFINKGIVWVPIFVVYFPLSIICNTAYMYIQLQGTLSNTIIHEF